MESELGFLRGIIFDLDGVLIDSFLAWHKLLNYALKSFNKKTLSKKEFEKFWGQGMEKDIEILLPEITLNDLQKFYENNFIKFSNYVKIFPEAKFVLKKIKEKNILISIASNSAPKIIDYSIRATKIDGFIDYYVGASNSIKGKPEPDILLKILEHLKLKNEEVIFVGDSPFDIEAGKKANIKTVGIGIKGDLQISKLGELPKLLCLE